MISVFRRASSTSARDLAEALDGLRAKTPERLLRRYRPGDVIIMWGDHLALPVGAKVLNNAPPSSKFSDAAKLARAGVATVEVRRDVPLTLPEVREEVVMVANEGRTNALRDGQGSARNWVRLIDSALHQCPWNMDLLQLRAQELNSTLGRLRLAHALPLEVESRRIVQVPGHIEDGWLARSNAHVGGNDLLNPPGAADYYSKKVELVKEFRVHSFLGKSIRAGMKVPREGFAAPHEWIRSWDGGWRILYDGVSSKRKHREIAHAAVAALGLQFGAVDIGELEDGSLIVLEVNRAPGLEGGTINAYANAIKEWINGNVA